MEDASSGFIILERGGVLSAPIFYTKMPTGFSRLMFVGQFRVDSITLNSKFEVELVCPANCFSTCVSD